jgi:hypothetical protein
MTRRGRSRWIAKGIQFGVMVAVGLYRYFKIKGLVPH